MTELELKLRRFAEEDFLESCYDFIKFLKIKYVPTAASDYGTSDFFSERFSCSHESFIRKIGRIDMLGIATPDTFCDHVAKVDLDVLLGENHYLNMMFFAVEIKERLNKTEFSLLTRALNQFNHQYPVVLFIKRYDREEKQVRLSLSMCERSEKTKTNKKGIESTSLTTGRVTYLSEINCQNPHQGHLRIIQKLASKCKSFDDMYSRWLEYFSNELLTKDFYDDLYKWYQWAIEPSTGVTFPNIVGHSEDDRSDISTNIIRLITRLLFVWFIKEKKLAPEELFNVDSLPELLKDFAPLANDQSNYYNAILQNLFFATLNNPIKKRAFCDNDSENNPREGVKALFRDNDQESWFAISHEKVLEVFRPIPFMNCGLFECLDKYANADIDTDEDLFRDGFSGNSEMLDGHFKYRAFVPNVLFFAKEHEEVVSVIDDNGRVKHETIKVAGLIPLLNKYQFTVEENTPSIVEVSLDPELLGQVFENLLAAYDPKTRSTARKATGSFYTPRKIVEYMVNESLVEFLDAQVDASKHETWRVILGEEERPFDLTDEERRNVLNKILNCKVLDPACGSGAFPMGMLHQMVHILRKIDPENKIWRDLVMERTRQEIDKLLTEREEAKKDRVELEERLHDVMRAFDNSVDNADYTRKLYIIQNCIFGSDIQPIAMLISKLRFFISLICEQDTRNLDYNDAEHNYGINTLPNLETKFVSADSLANAKVRDFEDDEWTIDKNLVQLKNELLEIRQSHFMANTQDKKLAKRSEDERKRRDIHNYILNQVINPDEAKIKAWTKRIEDFQKERKSYAEEQFREVEVTIQANLFEDAITKLVVMDINKEKRESIDREIKRLQRCIDKEKNKANKSDFISAVDQITSWNPYDQIKPAPFFDPDWMFNVKDGFDIVIGNPPYFQIRKGYYPASQYPYSEGKDPGKQNMYKLFVEHSFNNAKADVGVACMIVQSSLMCDLSSKHTRELLLKHTCLKQVIEFPKIAPTKEGQVFASVCQGTCIYLFRKHNPERQAFEISVNNDCTTISHMQFERVFQDALIDYYPEDFAIPLLGPNEFPLLKKAKATKSLSFYCESINQGDLNLTNNKEQIVKTKTGVKLIRGKSIGSYFADYDVNEYIKKTFIPDCVQKNQRLSFILCQEVSGLVDPRRIHCCISDTSESFLCGHTVNKILLKNSKNNEYILGILNSMLLDWVFRKTSSNNHVGGYELRQLPIKFAEDPSQIIGIVRKILDAKAKDKAADTSDWEFQLDEMIFDLYGFTKPERDYVRHYYVR